MSTIMARCGAVLVNPCRRSLLVQTALALVITTGACRRPGAAHGTEASLLHVGSDATRELFDAVDARFAAQWQRTHGERVRIRRSHGGSGKQTRAVLEGLEADVVSLSVPSDVDALSAGGLVAPDWRGRLPAGAAPFSSTVVFVVRAGNPRGVHGWADLARPGVGIVMPNPRTSGGARWAYLAAWGWALAEPGGSEARAADFVGRMLRNVVTFESGARGATQAFTRQGVGDVLLAWENEALRICAEDSGRYALVAPARSILATPSVAWVDRNVTRHGTGVLATAYTRFLFSTEAQEIVARFGLRPQDPAVGAREAWRFPRVERFDVEGVFGGWTRATQVHFAEGGTFDRLPALAP